MRVILLSAGYGSRLKPITDLTPKCLVLIKNKPLLEIWLDQLNKYGIDKYLINTHYLRKKVELFVENSIYKNSIKLVHEEVLLGTAGTLINNLDFYNNEDGMLMHADNYCITNLQKFKEAHFNRPKKCLITMLIFRCDEPSNCGIVEINDKGIVEKFHEKVHNPPSNLANAAIYILSKELIHILKENKIKGDDFSKDIIPQLLGKIYTYEISEMLIDIGTIDNYSIANR